MAVFDDPRFPLRFKAGRVAVNITPEIDTDACEVVVTEARGDVSYKTRKVRTHPTGKRRKQYPALFANEGGPEEPALAGADARY